MSKRASGVISRWLTITHHLSLITPESILLFWFLTSPVASFYLRFPFEKSLITYDRAMLASAALVALIKWRKEKRGFTATKFEIAWAMLTVVALLSALMKSNEAASALKLAVDSFALPVVAFHLARHHFDPGNRGRLILAAAIALALIVFAAGAYEFLSGSNLFPYKGTDIFRDREIRVNGPYLSDASFAAICLMLALFLRIAPAMLRVRFDRGAHFVYVCATAAAVAGSLLALFRTLALALVVCWVGLEILIRNRERARANQAKRLAAYASLILIVSGLWLVASNSSALARRLTSAHNVYGRLATWQSAASMAMENPLAGVGLLNYGAYFNEKYFVRGDLMAWVNETRPARSPHSNLFWIAAELGFVGLALYLIAFLHLFLAGYRALAGAKDEASRRAAASSLALLAAYLMTGATLTSGAYSDLNLCFFFLSGLLLNISSGNRRDHTTG